MTPKPIVTPRGMVYVNAAGKAELVWNTKFQQRWAKRFNAVQVFVDNEVLRLCEPYTPLRTGMLIKSSILGTVPGEGRVGWIAPYSRYQYYLKRPVGTETGPLRGPLWFHRMKVNHGKGILAGARAIAKKESTK